MKKLIIALMIIVAPGYSVAEKQFEIHGEGKIYRVTDGDTLWVTGIEKDVYRALWERSGDDDHFNHKYRSVKMRIGAIDTAESTHKDKRKNTYQGKVSSNYLRSRVEKDSAGFVCWDIGKYNRPICMVNAESIGDIGLHMIENGHSHYDTRFGLHPYLHREYLSAQ